jgi:hypothetical protein
MPQNPPRVAILGAGPIGLEAAPPPSAGGRSPSTNAPMRWPDTCGSGFFLPGAKSYGRNSQFLLRIGWQQVDDVFGLLDVQR